MRVIAVLFFVLFMSRAAAVESAAPSQSPSTTCGNGHLDAGETCAACAADCEIHKCTATGAPQMFAVQFATPPEMKVSSATVLVGYNSRHVSLPGSAGADSVRQRLHDLQKSAIAVTNDLDYGLRVVFTRPGGIETGRLLVLGVDACKGAAKPTANDFGCIVEGCAAATGKIDGCTCRVTQR
jgi:hypothetical protein